MTERSLLIFCLIPVWTLVLHSVLSRQFGKYFPRSRFAIMSGVMATASVIGSILYLEPPKHYWGILFFGLFNGMYLTQIYFQCFLMGETARRIRILINLALKRGSDTVDEYTPQHIIRIRMKRLTDLGQIRLENGRFKWRLSPLALLSKGLKAFQRIIFPTQVVLSSKSVTARLKLPSQYRYSDQ